MLRATPIAEFAAARTIGVMGELLTSGVLARAAQNTPPAGEFTGELYITFDEVLTVQRWNAGVLTTWESAPAAPWSLDVPAGTDPERWNAPEVVASTVLRVGGRAGLLGPFDVADVTVFDALAHIPYATLEVNTVLTSSPCGTVWTRTSFVDGRVAAAASGVGEPPGDPAVTATMSWEGYHRWRAGADVLEMIALTGDVSGKWTELLCLHGLVQEPAWTDAVAGLVPVPAALTEWATQAGVT